MSDTTVASTVPEAYLAATFNEVPLPVVRVPMLDREHQLVAYELLIQGDGDDESSLMRRVLSTIIDGSVTRLARDNRVFVRLSHELVMEQSELVLRYPRIGLVIDSAWSEDEAMMGRLQMLSQRGCALMLDLGAQPIPQVGGDRSANILLSFVRFVRLDATNLEPTTLRDHCEQLHARGLQVIAGRVELYPAPGEVKEKPNLDPTAKLGNAAGGLFGGGGGLIGGGDAKAEAPQTVLTAEWVELEVQSPGRPPRKVRRTAYDAIGPAARASAHAPKPEPSPLNRGLNFLGDTEILAAGCDISPAYAMYQSGARTLERQKSWMSLARETDAAKRRDLVGKVAADLAPPPTLNEFVLARSLLSGVRQGVYVDAPLIVTHRRMIEANAKGELVTRELIDVADNPIAVRAGTPDPYAVRIQQGIADTVAEEFVLGGNFKALENTASVFSAMAAKGVTPIVVRAVDDPAWKGVATAADVRAPRRSRPGGGIRAGRSR